MTPPSSGDSPKGRGAREAAGFGPDCEQAELIPRSTMSYFEAGMYAAKIEVENPQLVAEIAHEAKDCWSILVAGPTTRGIVLIDLHTPIEAEEFLLLCRGYRPTSGD